MQLDIAGFTNVVSPLDLVQRILAAGNFMPVPEADPQDGEVLLGEMSAEEKAIFSARQYIGVEVGGIARSRLEALLQEGGGELPGGEAALIHRCALLVGWLEALDGLLWTTIRVRFSEQLLATRLEDVEIRSDFRIVALRRGDEDDSAFIAELRDAFEEHLHNCDQCSQYAGSDLPTEKERN